MADFFRDTTLGYIVRFVSRNRFLKYPEEHADTQIPQSYLHPAGSSSYLPPDPLAEADLPDINDVLEDPEKSAIPVERPPLQGPLESNLTSDESSLKTIERVHSAQSLTGLEKIVSKADLERAVSRATMKREPTRPITPARTSDGTILVDWYTTDDPANPQNWSMAKKLFVTFQIDFYTFAVYMGSAIYTPSTPGVVEAFGTSLPVASLGLALYVLGYGLGPLLFSPLSEIPIIGRNPPYIITFGLFVILCVPTALADNIAGLLVLRFLQGFFGSPCLATGGATFGDMYSLLELPFLMTFWVAAATCGPSLGPLIGGFSVAAEGWRWSLWEILWISGPAFILLFLCLPETSASNILLRRAKRLRKVTGNNKLQSQSEIDQKKLNATDILVEALIRPIQIMVLDPAILFVTIYSSLTYAIYYSFFEAFPIVYLELYGFNIGELGLTFLSITVAIFIAIPIYSFYVYTVVNPKIRKHGLGPSEDRLKPALISSFLIPIGLFLFGWTANGSVHWIVSVIGITIYTMGIIIVFQCMFLYVPLSYPQYAASLFAGNDLARSALSAGAILFATPLFRNLGIGRGISLLAGLTVGGIVGIWVLWYYGAALRARSRFTAK